MEKSRHCCKKLYVIVTKLTWILQYRKILRIPTENNDDSDNKKTLETFACHKSNVKFLNSVMQLSAVASKHVERSMELLSKFLAETVAPILDL